MHSRVHSHSPIIRMSWSPANTAVTALLTILILTLTSQAQTYSVIHNFTGGWDGGRPEAGVTIDSAGNLYGTTFAIHGSVFELTHSGSAWVLTPLYVFTGGSDGASPYAGVSIGRDGTLFSTTVEGGQGGYGTVFHLRPSSLTLSPLG